MGVNHRSDSETLIWSLRPDANFLSSTLAVSKYSRVLLSRNVEQEYLQHIPGERNQPSLDFKVLTPVVRNFKRMRIYMFEGQYNVSLAANSRD